MKKLRSKKKTVSKDQPADPTSDRRPILFVYKLLNLVLPIAMLVLIRVGLTPLAIALALFSKWRVFAVKPRHMLANLRSNSVDIIVKISTLAFMIQADTLTEQIIWTAWYVAWLVLIKPATSKAMMTFQAAAAHFLGVSAVLLFSNNVSSVVYLIAIWVVALSAARHFLSSYEETKAQLIAQLWAFFALNLSWVLSSWLLVYVFVPQLIFILGVIAYALASIYDASKRDALKASFVRQQATMTVAILVLIIVLADWQANT